MMDENIRPCEICGALTTFERFKESEPHEGELCVDCDQWVCIDCIDWQRMHEIGTVEMLCKECS